MDNKQKATLVAAAHHLKPVVMIGQKGLTTNVIAEADQALAVHELIKVKISSDDKEERSAMAHEMCEKLNATVVKLIGNIAIVYRKTIG